MAAWRTKLREGKTGRHLTDVHVRVVKVIKNRAHGLGGGAQAVGSGALMHLVAEYNPPSPVSLRRDNSWARQGAVTGELFSIFAVTSWLSARGWGFLRTILFTLSVVAGRQQSNTCDATAQIL